MKTLEEYMEVAEGIVKSIDELKDGDRTVKLPIWLKIDKKLQWYFMWKTLKHYSGTPRPDGVPYDGTTCGGWVPNTKRINVGEAAL